MTEADRYQAIQLLNDAKMATDANQKVDLLKGLTELIVHKQPALLSEFLPEVTLLQTEPAVPVRKQLVELLEAAVRAQPSLTALVSVLSSLRQLLDDSSPPVVRRAIAACTIAYRPGHSAALALGRGPEVPPDVAAVWEACTAIRQRISQLAAEPVSDGMRFAAVKFMEFVIMLITSESAPKGALAMANHALLNPAQVARDAEALLLQLLGMVKQPVLGALPGTVAIVAIKSVGTLAAQRPQYLGRVLPTLLSAASAKSTSIADERSGVAASVDRAVKDGLMTVLRCKAPQALPWQKKIVAALHALGAGEQADAEVRRNERQAKRERTRQEDNGNSTAKRQRQEGSAEPPQALPPIALPLPLPAPAPPPHEPSILLRLLHECPDHTPENDLRDVLIVTAALADQNELETLRAFVERLPDAVLADAVIANLDHLPRREDVCDGVAAPAGTGGLAGLMQGLAQPGVPLQQAVVPKQEVPQAQPLVPLPTPPAPRQLALRRAQLPVLKLEPLPLTEQQATDLRLGAVRRVLSAEAAPVQHLRASVLASLATRASVGDMAADMVLSHLLASFQQPKGYDLALKWLYRLFVAHAGISVTSAAKAAASAHITQPERKAALASALDDDMAMPSAEEAASLPTAQDEAMKEAAPPDEGTSAAVPEQATSAAEPEQAASSAEPEQDGAGSSAGALVVRENNESEEGNRDWAANLVGSQYEIVLLAMLEGLREQQTDPKDRTIARLLMEAPALPQPAIAEFLTDVAAAGNEWAGLALQAAFDIIMGRPADRARIVDMVLSTATVADEDTRSKAVRLTANRLFMHSFLQDAVEEFAQAKLRELLPPPKKALPAPSTTPVLALENGSATPEAAAVPEQAQASGQVAPSENGSAAHEAASRLDQAPAADSKIASASNGSAAEDSSQKQNREAATEQQEGSGQQSNQPPAVTENGGSGGHDSASGDEQGASRGDRSEATEGHEMNGPKGQERNASTVPSQAADDTGARRESGSLASTSGKENESVVERGESLQGGNAAKGNGALAAAAEDHIGSVEEAQRRCDLFCALCTKKPELLHQLLLVYGKAPESAKAAIRERGAGLARVIGAASPVLADLLHKRPPPGSLPLLLSMLHTLTESRPPPASLVGACMDALERSRDVRFLVPALAGLGRQEVLVHLPKLLSLKDPAAFTAGMQRLLLPQPETGEPLLAPQEILVHILSLRKDMLPLKQHMAALTACLTMKLPDGTPAFPSPALASTLQQLVVRKPLPFLYMRFTIQANAASRELRGFVLDILSTLVSQAVWGDSQQWMGWIVCVRELLPDSLPVLLQLPLRNLGLALEKLPAKVALQAAEYVSSDRCGPLPRQTVALVQERAAAVKAAAEAQAAAPAQAAQLAA